MMKKIFLLLLLLCAAPDVEAQIRVTVASDNFNRANEDPLSNGGLWRSVGVANHPVFAVVSNKAMPTSSSVGGPDINWMIHTTAVNNDQWSEVLCEIMGSYCGLVLRWQASGTASGYASIVWENGNAFIQQMTNASNTEIGSASGVTTQGGTNRLEMQGTAIKLFIDDVQKISTSDPTWTSGVTGILGYALNNQTDTQLENFTMGNFSAGGGGIGRRRVTIE